MELTIDPEFKAQIPPLSQEEYRQLEQNIIEDGCRDPLVVWEHLLGAKELSKDDGYGFCKGTECKYEGQYVPADEWELGDGNWRCPSCGWGIAPWIYQTILLDGHHRLEICKKHNIEYQVTELDFDWEDDARQAAADWIDANQLGRRNLTADQFKVALGRRYLRMKKGHGGDRKSGKSKHQNDVLKTSKMLADEYGVGQATVERAATLAKQVQQDPELQQAINDRVPLQQVKRAQKERARESKRQENAEKISNTPDIATLQGVFTTIVVDPPWDWSDEGDVNQMGRAKPDYHTMPLAELLSMPVASLAAQDAHLYLWTTNRSMPKAFALLDAWGFRYITCLTWCKPSFGMGNYFRGSTEHVLFGVRGSLPLNRNDAGTWFQWARPSSKHSAKPTEFYELVESCSPKPYLDAFSRTERPGWTTWGADATHV